MQNEPKRYFGAIRLGDDVPPRPARPARREAAAARVEFREGRGSISLLVRRRGFVGLFFLTARDIQIIRAELDKATTHGDRFLIL